MDTRTHPARARIAAAQAVLKAQGIAALLVPSSDPHLSEYLPDHWKAREHFSGFTGSMGTLVITQSEAAVFADSRYTEQAQQELAGSGIELVNAATGLSTEYIGWAADRLKSGDVLAADGAVLSLALANLVRSTVASRGVVFKTDADVLAACWPEREGLPAAKVRLHDVNFTGEATAEKIARVREALAVKGATHSFVSTLDDIAWLTNLRGADVNYNPVFIAHVLIAPDALTLFVDERKFSADLKAALAKDGIRLAPYEAAKPALANLPTDAVLFLDPKRVTLGVRECVKGKVIEGTNPSTLFKSRKLPSQAAHIRKVMEEDGAAMCHFYAWFEAAQQSGERITELTIDEKLSAERAKRPGFQGLSFSTIAGFNANGALPHYRAVPQAHAVIEGQGLLLIDSGGQYEGGTTDITRVWPVGGELTPEQKRDCTLVFKGMCALSRAKFPSGTLSPFLDTIARAPIWQALCEYGHGTGHGVGYFMNVHEGPHTISKAVAAPDMAMEEGMITSNEPGLYRPGRWGVRIENLVMNVSAGKSEFGEFLEFETLTLCPIDVRCFDLAMLDASEIAWLNAYHAEVLRRLSPLVSGPALNWLKLRTQPV
jgi:Xaa-Pro aminopeptidase